MTKRSLSLLLAHTPGIGGKSISRIATRNELLGRSPWEFLGLSVEALKEEYRLQAKVAQKLVEDRDRLIEVAAEAEERLSRHGISWVTAGDAHYPEMIEEMHPEPPGVLYLYGNSRLLEAKTFAVLASRGTLPVDLELIERLTEEGVMAAEVLVSSHDRPEYQRSAIVPLRWGAPRILCLDRGVYHVLGEHLSDEPFPAARLWRYEFDPKTDLVIGSALPTAEYRPNANKDRDGLVGSLSRRLDFVNVEPGGGMEKILKMALKAGRQVRISDRCPVWRQYVTAGATRLEV